MVPFRRRAHPLRNAARLRKILSVFAGHGFHNFAERIRLGRFVLGKISKYDENHYSMAERLRMSFEQLGPTFVKLGQLLATRPDLIPQDFSEEFKKLHDQVSTVDFDLIEKVLRSHFGAEPSQVFRSFDNQPLAAASIAQVYKAELNDGAKVVVKVQRPGIEEIISEDLNILYGIAELLEKYVPESRPYNPVGIIDEFFKSLELETNFIIEANNIRRFSKNFSTEPNIRIPHVYDEYTGRKVLVMEYLDGIPLSQKSALEQEGIDSEVVLRRGLRFYLKMVFSDGLFHGDLHAGNMMVLRDNKIGLIDFGVVGRLNRRTQTAIANMLVALAHENYDRMAYEYVDLAPYTPHVDVDLFARDLRDLIAPYYGLTLKNVNAGKLLLDSTAIAARYQLKLPAELVMFFKSIVTIEGMGRMISKDFDFLTYSLEFASELVQSKYEASKWVQDLSRVGRDVNSLMATLPFQLKQFLRRVNSPEFGIEIDVRQLNQLKKSMEKSGKRHLMGWVIASLVLSATIVFVFPKGPFLLGVPVLTWIGYGLSLLFIVWSLL